MSKKICELQIENGDGTLDCLLARKVVDKGKDAICPFGLDNLIILVPKNTNNVYFKMNNCDAFKPYSLLHNNVKLIYRDEEIGPYDNMLVKTGVYHAAEQGVYYFIKKVPKEVVKEVKDESTD